MTQRRESALNAPALVPIAGNIDRKARVLDRDVTTIGRARGSDLCMEANEISILHCVIYRTIDGFRIRDCNSRCGTRVNGENVRNSRLQDGDIVNLGPFSFEFRLPPSLFPTESGRPDPLKVEHWIQSRRKLGQLALKLRKRLRHGIPSTNEQEWAQKAHLLKEKIRCYDQRLRELEEAEEELAAERSQLERSTEDQRRRVQAMEADLAQRIEDVEAQIRNRWQEFQQRCKAEESRAKASESSSERPSLGNDELRSYLITLEEQLAHQQEQLHREQEEFTKMKEQWVKAQSKTSSALEDQQASLAEQESAVRAQKAELARMMAELRKMQEDLRKQARPDVRILQETLERSQRENAELRAAIEELQHREPVPTVPDETVEKLREEIKLLYDELESKETILQNLQTNAASDDSREVSQLRAENDLLKKLLEEKSNLIAESSVPQLQSEKNEGDLERYEAELNQFRRQLEGDRNKLNKELEMLRERNRELDEAVREMEMEMSRERAELARERTRLDRVREEIKTDMERLQREAAVRDSMAPVQKLRDEINGKQPAGAKGEKLLNDRLRSIRTHLNDSPAASS